MCCTAMCQSCAEMGVHKKVFSKIGYIFFGLFWIFVSIFLLFYATNILGYIHTFTLITIECPSGGTACFGVSAIYRMSFVLAVFHSIMLIICLTRSGAAAYFHDGCWTFKFLVITCAFILSLWIPNTFFISYGNWA